MWKRFSRVLRCSACRSSLDLRSFEESTIALQESEVRLAGEQGMLDDDFNRWIESGVLLCPGCRVFFPIIYGLPVLLLYRTPVHDQFDAACAAGIAALGTKYRYPDAKPERGERFVMESFSKEWLDYHYDGVMWGLNYDDHERRFLCELGLEPRTHERAVFLEIGCGLGLTTYLAQKNYCVDAVGVDLSRAVIKAADHYRTNPFLHFVQASAFHLPFAHGMADIVYSRGVLHVTYSTRAAFEAVAPFCRPGGLLYIWVYGSSSKKGSLLRRAAYVAETVARPLLARHGSSILGRATLSLLASGYVVVNAYHRARNPSVQPYNYRRALHAARDRFTPLFAHRHDFSEVAEWYRAAGLERIEEVDWRTMPRTDHDDYRRNTGVRGRRAVAAERADGLVV